MCTPSFDVKILVEKVRIICGYLRWLFLPDPFPCLLSSQRQGNSSPAAQLRTQLTVGPSDLGAALPALVAGSVHVTDVPDEQPEQHTDHQPGEQRLQARAVPHPVTKQSTAHRSPAR